MMTVHCFDKFLQTARGLVLLIKEKRGFFFPVVPLGENKGGGRTKLWFLPYHFLNDVIRLKIQAVVTGAITNNLQNCRSGYCF